MNELQAIILGIIQGITEFLPVSSSAHLVLTPYLFGWQIPEQYIFPFDVLVQMGTLVAVLIYFRRDLIDIVVAVVKDLLDRQVYTPPKARLGWYLILASIPAGILGLALKDTVESVFKNPQITAAFLLGTAALLVVAERVGKRSRQIESIRWLDALVIGFSQALALFPGISRSGATIAGGMVRNLDRTSAARFSFMMSIPVMLAAGLVGLVELINLPDLSSFLPSMGIGFLVSAIVGYASIHWLLKFISHRPLYPFAIYCTLVAFFILVFSYVQA